jgi:tetratricopeptide (TPR) repeat protein
VAAIITSGVIVVLVLIAIVQTACATLPAGPPPGSSAPPGSTEARAQALLERGQLLLGRGEMAAAVTSLRQALRLRPDLAPARASLGLALYGMGDLDAAVDELRASLARAPDDVPVRLALATALIARQDWHAARSELEPIASTRPDLLQAQYSLGVVRYALGDLDGAIDAYRRVLAGDPQHQDARYNLALVLQLAHRDAEATPELLAAAEAGHARAQYFAGTAYAGGLGVERNLAFAIRWWLLAAEQGVTPAHEALVQWRQVALGRGRRVPLDRQAAEQAFRDYRAALWKDFPDLTADGNDTVGGALLRQGRVREAVPVLIREASAMSEPAQRLLETLYEQGVDGQLAAHDARILGYLEAAAAEGLRAPTR